MIVGDVPTAPYDILVVANGCVRLNPTSKSFWQAHEAGLVRLVNTSGEISEIEYSQGQIIITVRDFKLSEPLNEFPSEKLLAQVMLVGS
jgi:hypothetical protein